MNSVFPRTAHTQIENWIIQGDTASLRRYIMEVYFEPLCKYYRGSHSRDRHKDAAEVVSRFFERYLIDREGGVVDYLRQWLEKGDRPLRKHLIGGFWLSLHADSKKVGPREEPAPVGVLDDAAARTEDAEAEFEQACIVETVRFALKRTEEELRTEGKDLHWEVFVRHGLQGRTYPEIEQELGIPAEQAGVKCRLAKHRFRSHVLALAAQERKGVGREFDVLRSYLESLKESPES